MRFKGPEHALRWAFAMHEKAHYASVDLYKSRSTDPQGLTMFDAHAQAGQFLRHVDALPREQALAMYASYAHGKDRKTATQALAEHWTEHRCGETLELLADVIGNVLTRKPPVRRVALRHGVSYRRVIRVRRKVEEVWLPLHLRAIDALALRWSEHL